MLLDRNVSTGCNKFLCDALIRKGAPVLQLLSSKNQTLLIRGDAVREG